MWSVQNTLQLFHTANWFHNKISILESPSKYMLNHFIFIVFHPTQYGKRRSNELCSHTFNMSLCPLFETYLTQLKYFSRRGKKWNFSSFKFHSSAIHLHKVHYCELNAVCFSITIHAAVGTRLLLTGNLMTDCKHKSEIRALSRYGVSSAFYFEFGSVLNEHHLQEWSQWEWKTSFISM